MYENFYKYFDINKISLNSIVVDDRNSINGFNELLKALGGQSFNKGIYRLHTLDHIERWNDTVIQAFPEFKGRITCFGYDWLGRQFALDNQRVENGQPQILMFEPGTAEVLEIPCNIIQFHEEEIPDYHDSCLASEFFKEWILRNHDGIKISECVGYKILLFLGGEDTIQNLEKNDMEVYWSICSQLIQKTKGLSEGAVIEGMKISE